MSEEHTFIMQTKEGNKVNRTMYPNGQIIDRDFKTGEIVKKKDKFGNTTYNKPRNFNVKNIKNKKTGEVTTTISSPEARGVTDKQIVKYSPDNSQELQRQKTQATQQLMQQQQQQNQSIEPIRTKITLTAKDQVAQSYKRGQLSIQNTARALNSINQANKNIEYSQSLYGRITQSSGLNEPTNKSLFGGVNNSPVFKFLNKGVTPNVEGGMSGADFKSGYFDPLVNKAQENASQGLNIVYLDIKSGLFPDTSTEFYKRLKGDKSVGVSTDVMKLQPYAEEGANVYSQLGDNSDNPMIKYFFKGSALATRKFPSFIAENSEKPLTLPALWYTGRLGGKALNYIGSQGNTGIAITRTINTGILGTTAYSEISSYKKDKTAYIENLPTKVGDFLVIGKGLESSNVNPVFLKTWFPDVDVVKVRYTPYKKGTIEPLIVKVPKGSRAIIKERPPQYIPYDELYVKERGIFRTEYNDRYLDPEDPYFNYGLPENTIASTESYYAFEQPIKAYRYSPTKTKKVYTLGYNLGTKSLPIFSYVKGEGAKGFSFGIPKFAEKINPSQLKSVFNAPESSMGGKVANRLIDFTPEELVRIKLRIKTTSANKNILGDNPTSPVFKVEGIQDPEFFTSELLDYSKENRAVIFGTSVGERLNKPYRVQLLGDVDVEQQGTANIFTLSAIKQKVKRLQEHGEDVLINPDNPTEIISGITRKKIVEVKFTGSPELSAEITENGFYGLYQDTRAFPFSKGYAKSIGEHGRAKAESITKISPPAYNKAGELINKDFIGETLSFSTGGLLGKNKKDNQRGLKDTADYFRVQKGIIEKGLENARSTKEKVKLSNTEEDLRKELATYSPAQQVDITKKMTERSGTTFIVADFTQKSKNIKTDFYTGKDTISTTAQKVRDLVYSPSNLESPAPVKQEIKSINWSPNPNDKPRTKSVIIDPTKSLIVVPSPSPPPPPPVPPSPHPPKPPSPAPPYNPPSPSPPYTPPKYPSSPYSPPTPYKDNPPRTQTSMFSTTSNMGIQGYDVFVRRKGKFSKVNAMSFSKGSALNYGRYVVGNTAGATFTIRPSTSKIGGEFTSIGNIGDYYKKGNLFIEKPNRRIKSLGELSEITYKGLSAKKRYALSGKRAKNIFGGM